VRVVDVDGVGAEAAQAVFDLVDDVPAGQPSCRVEPTFTGLGRDHHVVASADEGAAEDLLGGFAFSGWWRAGPVEGRGRPVDVGGVEEVDAEIERRMDHTSGFLRVRRDAEPSSAQADLRHLHTSRAEQGVLHRSQSSAVDPHRMSNSQNVYSI
jgi:hypothetical protein